MMTKILEFPKFRTHYTVSIFPSLRSHETVSNQTNQHMLELTIQLITLVDEIDIFLLPEKISLPIQIYCHSS